MRTRLSAFAERRWHVRRSRLRIHIVPLGGGLESRVALAHVTSSEPARGVPSRVVIKQLSHRGAREAEVYGALWRTLDRPPAVRAFGHERSPWGTFLYLEHAEPCSAWPWRETALSAAVCGALARLHDTPGIPAEPFSWDYETELERSAAATLAAAEACRTPDGRRLWTRLGDLRRVVAALPVLRRRLLAGPVTIIHGDVHPGNVILRHDRPTPTVLLIDWARARVGSPFEDVASWLHSLGCWEPEARRRHDTLMAAYLRARAIPGVFDREARTSYWLASVSNGLAGAIRYHLAVLADPRPDDDSRRGHSHRALPAWMRVVRRVAVLLRTNGLLSTSRDR